MPLSSFCFFQKHFYNRHEYIGLYFGQKVSYEFIYHRRPYDETCTDFSSYLLFEHVNKKQFTGVVFVFLHAQDLGLRRDLVQQ